MGEVEGGAREKGEGERDLVGEKDREREREGEGEGGEEEETGGTELVVCVLELCCVRSACVCPPRTVTCWEATSSTQIYEEPISRGPICRMLLSKWLQSPDYQHK